MLERAGGFELTSWTQDLFFPFTLRFFNGWIKPNLQNRFWTSTSTSFLNAANIMSLRILILLFFLLINFFQLFIYTCDTLFKLWSVFVAIPKKMLISLMASDFFCETNSFVSPRYFYMCLSCFLLLFFLHRSYSILIDAQWALLVFVHLFFCKRINLHCSWIIQKLLSIFSTIHSYNRKKSISFGIAISRGADKDTELLETNFSIWFSGDFLGSNGTAKVDFDYHMLYGKYLLDLIDSLSLIFSLDILSTGWYSFHIFYILRPVSLTLYYLKLIPRYMVFIQCMA